MTKWQYLGGRHQRESLVTGDTRYRHGNPPPPCPSVHTTTTSATPNATTTTTTKHHRHHHQTPSLLSSDMTTTITEHHHRHQINTTVSKSPPSQPSPKSTPSIFNNTCLGRSGYNRDLGVLVSFDLRPMTQCINVVN